MVEDSLRFTITAVLPSCSRRSLANGSAIYPHDLPGHELRGRTDEKAGNAGDVFGGAPAGQGVSRRTRSCQAGEAALPQAVLIQPGASALTRTPAPGSSARLRVNAMTAPLVAAKSSPESPSMPVSAWSQPIVTMVPCPCAFILRPTSRQSRIVAADVDRPEEIELGIEREMGVRAGQCIGPGDLEPGIQAVPDSPGLFHQPVAGGPVGKVGHQNLRSHPSQPQVACQVFRRLRRRFAVDDHIGTGLGQCHGHGSTNAGCGTENGCASPLQWE